MTWQTKKLGEVLKLEYGKPLPRSHRKSTGLYPVYGANGIKTFSDKFYVDKPSIVVGRKGSAGELSLTDGKFWPLDVAYFITFDEKKYDLKFLYNLLETLELPRLARGVKPGINRDEVYSIEINVPSFTEQKRIANKLDEIFKKVTKAKEAAEKNLQNSKELFESYLQSVFANLGKDWEEKRLKEVCEELFAGGDVPKKHSSKVKTDKYDIPIYANGVKDKGLYGYTNIKRVAKPSVTISARGTIGYSEIRNEAFFPVVRLIVLVPNPKIIDVFYLYYITRSFSFSNTGTSIPQLTIPMVENLKIALPPLNEQKIIIERLEKLSAETKKLEKTYEQKLANLEELKKSVLSKAFHAEL